MGNTDTAMVSCKDMERFAGMRFLVSSVRATFLYSS